MGGRGSSSSSRASTGGGGGLGGLTQAFSGTSMGRMTGTGQLNTAPFQRVPDYTDDNNPELLKWQGQTDDKAASYLHKIDPSDSKDMSDLNKIQADTNDPYSFYNLPAQRFISNMGLNAPTTVLSDTDFNNYVNQTGATVLYRGWANGAGSITKFNTSVNNHVGNGFMGDGHYYAPDIQDALGYAGSGHVVSKAALSPKARVVSLVDVQNKIHKSSGKFQSALSKAGSYGSRTYGPNIGEMQMALKMGYNTIDCGWAVIPITRDAIVVSAKRAR